MIKIKRENGNVDKIQLSLYIYLVKADVYEKVVLLLKEEKLEYKSSKIANNELKHRYYLGFDLDQDFDAEALSKALKCTIMEDEKLEAPFNLYCSLTSAYDHTGVEIVSDSKIFILQRNLNCSLNFNCTLI